MIKASEQEKLDKDQRALKIYQRQLYSSGLTDTEVADKIATAKALMNKTK